MKFCQLHEIAILANWMLDTMKKDGKETFYKEHIKTVKELRKICSHHPENEIVLIDTMPF